MEEETIIHLKRAAMTVPLIKTGTGSRSTNGTTGLPSSKSEFIFVVSVTLAKKLDEVSLQNAMLDREYWRKITR